MTAEKRRGTPVWSTWRARLTAVAIVTALPLAGVQAPSTAAADTVPLGRPPVPASPSVDLPDYVAPTSPGGKRAAEALAATAESAARARAEQVTANAGKLKTLSGTTSARRMAVAAAAAAAGGKDGGGDPSATPLSPSSTWSAGSGTGSFSWTYPIGVPPAAAGPQPDLKITYDSSVVDGRLPSVNTQSSWVGEGFDLSTSYVERSYASCRDDGRSKKYDLCWKNDNASIVLNGRSTEIIKDDTTGTWRLKDDDASKVQRLTGAANGAQDGEYWQVTTTDGTKYVFGLEKLPGAGATTRTNSVWTAPVFGDDDGEPCHASTFAASSCTQAWRWNLDYVVDLHGNAMTSWYTEETNNYAKNGDESPGTKYSRSGYLNRIDYGLRSDDLFAAAPQRVTFQVAERCVASGTGCDSLTSATENNWPDVPRKSICKDGDECKDQDAPSFFTRKRLVGVKTEARDVSVTPAVYRTVDTWALKHSYLDPGDVGDATDQSLWLDSVQRTTPVGGKAVLEPVKFSHTMLANRVDGSGDNIVPMTKPRVYTITSETGGVTTVNYSGTECTASGTKPAVDSNTKRCFPNYWYLPGAENPRLDWFHKYVVGSVRLEDPTAGGLAVVNDYAYSGGAGWRYAQDPITPANRRTWSQWRGFSTVTVSSGEGAGVTKTKNVSVFFRGLDGDRQSSGPVRVEKVKGITAPDIDDSDQYAGMLRESAVYNGAALVSGQVNSPWSSQTSSHAFTGYTAKAYLVRTRSSQERTTVTSGTTPTTRTRTTTTTFDTSGFPTTVDDTGDAAKTGDESCTRYWYARNTSKNLLTPVSRKQALARTCASVGSAVLPANSATSGDVISDSATAFDTTTWSASHTPTLGQPRWAGRASGYSSGTPTWQKVSLSDFDALGRLTSVADASGNTTTTAYTPTAGGPMTKKVDTNAAGHATTTIMDLSRNQATKVTDANGKVSEMEYDALGRLTSVWLPNNARSSDRGASHSFTYKLSATAASWVSSKVLLGGGEKSATTYSLYDAMLRPRQTQMPSPLGGRIVTETLYDSRGLTTTSRKDLWDSDSNPSGTLAGVAGGEAPSETVTEFDGAARPVKATFRSYGVDKWSTATTYTGDSVAQTALAGGSAGRQFSDALGRVVERREYASTSPTAATYTSTVFAFDPRGRLSKVTGPDAAAWTYGYDLFGRTTSTTDPDRGSSTTTYTVLDQVDTSTDSEARKLLYSYDKLGRKTGTWSASRTDANKLAAWTFDSVDKGKPASAIRYVGGVSGSAYVKSVVDYDDMYRVKNQTVQLPDSDPLVVAGVPKSLTFKESFNLDGSSLGGVQPAVGGLPSESMTIGYNALMMPTTLAGATGVVSATTYSSLGDVQQMSLSASQSSTGKKVYLTNTYEAGTRRLTRASVTDDVHSYMAQDSAYTYDNVGNVTSLFDAASLQGTGKTDYQCFRYDGYRRISEAWTPGAADCADSKRTAAGLGGAAPYWSSYAYKPSGLRASEVTHAAAGNTTVAYTYPTTAVLPHALSKTTSTPPKGSAVTKSFTYDKTGNTITRPGVTAATQTLAWDAEGRLKTASEPANGKRSAHSNSYLYDADGELLIRRPTNGAGETTLYLGATEVRLKVAGTSKTVSGLRYYSHAGRTVAVRKATAGISGSSLTWLISDHHATVGLTISGDDTQTITKRYTTIFGGTRGAQPTWVDDKRFLGKPADASHNLTHIGAREYDPNIGRFISVDPILDTGNAQSLNGYIYAENRPLTYSDPSGLRSGAQCGPDGLLCADPRTGLGGTTTTTTPTTPTTPTPSPQPSSGGSDLGTSAPVLTFVQGVFKDEYNKVAGVYNGAWKAVGPGAVGDVLALIPTDFTQDRAREIEAAHKWLEAHGGADTTSANYVWADRGTQVASVAAGGAGAIRGVWLAVKAYRARAALSATSTGARVFSSTDAHVAEAANAIEKAMPGRVNSVNSMVGMKNGLKREIDIDLGNILVQVKSDNARKLIRQMNETSEMTGRRVIGYAPDMPHGARAEAMRQGVPIAGTHDELIAIIREFG